MATNPLLVIGADGAPHISPSVSSSWTFDITTSTRYLAQRDVFLLSYMEGGPANQVEPFLDVQSLQSVYDPESLGIIGSDLASYLKVPGFSPDTRGAYRIYVIRLGQPTASQLTLLDGASAQVLLLQARDQGTYTNKISVAVANGTVTGKMLSFRFRQELVILDNLRNSFGLAYTGNASAATLTILRSADKATRLQTTLTGATDGSISLDLDLTQDAFATVQQLVQYLDGQNGYQSSIDPYGDPLLPTSALDAVAGATIRTPPALLIRYIGAGSAATMTTSATALTTTVTGASGQNLNIDLTAPSTNTLGEVVNTISALSGVYFCSLGPNADPNAPAQGLFSVVGGQDIRTVTYTLTANPGTMQYVETAALGSIIWAVNTRVPRATATIHPGATTVPANIPQTFFAGGTNPVPTTADWLAALLAIEQQDLIGGLVFPVSTDPVIQAAVNAWVAAEHNTQGKAYRAFYAPPDLTTTDQAKAMALGFNTTYGAMIPQAIVADTGITEQAPLYPAAMYCGAAAGALPTQSVTRTVIRARSLPARSKYSKAVKEDLLSNGVTVLEETQGVGVRIAMAVTTSLSPNRPFRMLSESMAIDVIDQRIRAYVEPLIPHWASIEYIATVKG